MDIKQILECFTNFIGDNELGEKEGQTTPDITLEEKEKIEESKVASINKTFTKFIEEKMNEVDQQTAEKVNDERQADVNTAVKDVEKAKQELEDAKEVLKVANEKAKKSNKLLKKWKKSKGLDKKDESLEDYDDPQGKITLRDAKKEFEQLVKEASDIYWQGYKFIDITGLENACPSFTNINWEDIPELIRSWGYVVVDDSNEEEPAISLVKGTTEEDIKEMIKAFNKENGFDESPKESTTVVDNDKEFKVPDEAYDIVRKNLLDVMRGYGWVDLEQLQEYIKDEGLELTDEELIAVAKTCLKYTKVYDASELQDTDLQDIEDAYGTVIVVGDFKRLPKNESLKEKITEEVVAKFDNGKHEIVKCKEGYFNRYNIKNGKARTTTKCLESLPSALMALKKRFPKAEEVKEKE